MGQPIRILSTTLVGDLALFGTDRSVTGQEGDSFSREDEPGDGFPGRLAERIFEADDRTGHVFVASNQVVVRRDGGWDDAAASAIGGVIARFFVFYEETPVT